MKKFFLVMVFWLIGGVALAFEPDPYQDRQASLLLKEAQVITGVHHNDPPTFVPVLRQMSPQQRATILELDYRLWKQFKGQLLQRANRTPEMELALDKAYDRYATAIEAHIGRMEAAENRHLDEMRDALIVDGLGQNSSKICVPLAGGVVDCF